MEIARQRRTIKWVVGALVALAIAGYGVYRTKDLILGPRLAIISPADGTSFNQPLIKVEGRAKKVAYLYLNGRSIFTNKEGNFGEELLLLPGYNIIEIRARDKFNREIIKELHLFYAQENSSG